MKVFTIFFVIIISGCSSDSEVSKPIPDEEESLSNIQHSVHYEFRSATINGVEFKPRTWIKKTFVTNVKKIIPLEINDSITLGVEVVLHEMRWRDDLEYISNIYYYEKGKNGKWYTLSNKPDPLEFYYDCKHIFSSEFIQNDVVYFSVNHAITIVSRDKKSKNTSNNNSTVSFN